MPFGGWIDFAELIEDLAICGRVGWSKECCMGITVKHVVVAALIFALVGFVYVIGFSEIDRARSPRARAMDAHPSAERLIGNVRGGMASGQGRIARALSPCFAPVHPANSGLTFPPFVPGRPPAQVSECINPQQT